MGYFLLFKDLTITIKIKIECLHTATQTTYLVKKVCLEKWRTYNCSLAPLNPVQ